MKKKYATPKETQNENRLREFVEYGETSGKAEWYYNEFAPKLNAQRQKVATMKYRLQAELNKLNELEKLNEEIQLEENTLYQQTFDYHTDFEPTLTDEQIKILLPVINKYVCVDPQTIESVREWLVCDNLEPVRVKSNAQLCCLLNELSKGGYICGNAQTVAEQNETFAGMRGKVITQSNMTASLRKYWRVRGVIEPSGTISEEMKQAVEALGQVKG